MAAASVDHDRQPRPAELRGHEDRRRRHGGAGSAWRCGDDRAVPPDHLFRARVGEHRGADAELQSPARRDYRLYWHFANPFNVRNLRANPVNLFGGTVELNVFAAPAGRAAPAGLTEISSPRDEPPRPPVGHLSGAVVAEYLPDLPVPTTRSAKAPPAPPQPKPPSAAARNRMCPRKRHDPGPSPLGGVPADPALSAIGYRGAHPGQSLVSADGNRYPVVDGTPVLVRHVQPFHIAPASPSPAAPTIGAYTPVLDAGPGWKLRLGADGRSSQDPSVLCLDSRPLPNVDLVVEPEALPFADGSVVYFEATTGFEQVYDPLAAAHQFRCVLADGGMFFINTAFMQAYHGRPDHYLNMTSQERRRFWSMISSSSSRRSPPAAGRPIIWRTASSGSSTPTRPRNGRRCEPCRSTASSRR